jgi:hypothetical protein
MSSFYKENEPPARNSILDDIISAANKLANLGKPKSLNVVFNPMSFDALKNQVGTVKTTDMPTPFDSFYGIPVYIKDGQKSECIIIDNPTVAKAYLVGLISEEQLLENSNKEPQ